MAVSVVFFVAVLISTLGIFGNALQCRECENIEVSSNLFKTKSNSGCKSATSTTTVQCPDDNGYACVYIEAEGKVENPLLGSTTVKVEARGCSPKLLQSNGCSSGDQSGVSFVKTLFSIAADIDIDGMYCECNTDLCVAGCSGLYVADTCLAWWIVGVSGAGALLVLILLCTCCCCCCGCCGCCGIRGCCNKARPGVTLVQTPAAPSTYVRLQSPIGGSNTNQELLPGKTTIVGIENPYYD